MHGHFIVTMLLFPEASIHKKNSCKNSLDVGMNL